MTKKIATLGQLAAALQVDPSLAARVKDDPAGAIAGLAAPLQTDVWIYRIVVGALALAILGAVGGAILLAMSGRGDPGSAPGHRLWGRGRSGWPAGAEPSRRSRMKRRHELQAACKPKA